MRRLVACMRPVRSKGVGRHYTGFWHGHERGTPRFCWHTGSGAGGNTPEIPPEPSRRIAEVGLGHRVLEYRRATDAMTGSPMLQALHGGVRIAAWTERLDRQEVGDPDFEPDPQQRDRRWRVIVRRGISWIPRRMIPAPTRTSSRGPQSRSLDGGTCDRSSSDLGICRPLWLRSSQDPMLSEALRLRSWRQTAQQIRTAGSCHHGGRWRRVASLRLGIDDSCGLGVDHPQLQQSQDRRLDRHVSREVRPVVMATRRQLSLTALA